jgi:hypothetical protein
MSAGRNFLCGRRIIRVALSYVVHKDPPPGLPSGVRHRNFVTCNAARRMMNEGQRTRNRIFALSNVNEESITCYNTEIRIGLLDDERSRGRGSWVVGRCLQDSFPIR